MNLIEIKEVRKLVANIYWSLKKDHKALLEQGDDKEVYYDVGMIVGYLRSLNKDKLAERKKQYRQNLPSMIYEIQNTITKQIYVGQTSQGRMRWNAHKLRLRKGIHNNHKLQKSWNIWGEDAFYFNVVEELPPDLSPELLLEKETALILEHVSNGTRLYNIRW